MTTEPANSKLISQSNRKEKARKMSQLMLQPKSDSDFRQAAQQMEESENSSQTPANQSNDQNR